MVIVLLAKLAETPAGNPEGTPIPVAPVVVMVIFVSAVLTHNEGVLEGALAVRFAVTVMVPVALTVPQPPVKGME